MDSHRRSSTILLTVVLVVTLATGIYWCSQKKGLTLDETYSYGLSNSDGAPFLSRLFDDGIAGHVVSHGELLGYVAADPGETFDYASVYYNQTQDVHPPLYYCLLHTVCSLFPGTFSVWFGLGLNLVVFAGTMVLLFLLGRLLMHDDWGAATACLLYGLSQAGLSTLLLIRMYLLLTFFTVLLTYLVARYIDKPYAASYPAIAATMFAGMMTQYFFVIYAFFLCAAFDLWLLAHRRFRTFALFSLSAVLGLALMLVVFPSWWSQLHSQSTVSLDTVNSNATAGFDLYAANLGGMTQQLWAGLPLPIIVAAVALVAVCVLAPRHSDRLAKPAAGTGLITVSFVLSFVVIAVISPYLVLRYAYQLLPLITLCCVALLWVIKPVLGRPAKVVVLASAVIVSLALPMAAEYPPDYLCSTYPQIDDQLDEHTGEACVYMTPNANPAITSDLWHLLEFDDVCVTTDATNDLTDAYIEAKGADDLTVFVATYPTYPDIQGTLDRLCDEHGYSTVSTVSEGDLSNIYLLTR